MIDEIESAVRGFKPTTYDVSRQLRAIEAFEQQAVKNAEETKMVVEREMADLEKTLTNIEGTRPFGELTTVRISFLFFWMGLFLCLFSR